MSKLLITSLILAFSLATSITQAASLFEERVAVIDNVGQDEIFGGSKQSELVITFTPRLNHDEGEAEGKDGDYQIIVDKDDDNDLRDETPITTGSAVNGTSVIYRMSKSSLSGLVDGEYRVYVVIDDNANGKIDWGEESIDYGRFVLDTILTITEVVADPDIFSPNGDGIKDTTTIYYTLSEDLTSRYSEITITIGDTGQKILTAPAKPTPGTRKGRNSVVWNGKDGLGRYVEDGNYTVRIAASDAGGNEATASVTVKVVTKAPELVSTTPARDSFVSTLTEVIAQLKDNSGEGIDFTKSTIRLLDMSNKEIAGTQSDNNVDRVSWKLSSPLPGDGSKDGKYTIVVTIYDKVGNFATVNSTFYYDTVFPIITSITPADGAILTTPPANVIIVMNDGTGSGNDLGATAKTIKVDDSKTAGSAIHNGINTITFTPYSPFTKGIHIVEITPTDFAGNKPTQPFKYQFGYFENISDILPEVESVVPPDKSFTNTITKVTAKLKDNSGKGIDLNSSTIRLEGPGNVQIPGTQTDDKNLTISWELTNPIPTDGSADGTYTIKVKAVDKSGGTKEHVFTFLYDTKVPTLTSITPSDNSIITTTLTEIIAKVSDGAGSGVDFAASRASMKLMMGTKEIPNILRRDNGVDTMTFSFPSLEDTGRYTIEIKLKDRAGNEHTYQLGFDFVKKETDILPEVVSIEPQDRAFKNSVTKATATLKDNSGKGLDLSASTIRLESPNKTIVPGVQTDNAKDSIAWELTNPLPADGSEDGTYTIKVKAVDKAGRSKDYNFTFLYDTQVPVLTSITPADGATITDTKLTEIVMKVTDGAGSGVDFAASRASMKLMMGTKEIPNILRRDNGVDTLTFNFPALEDTGKYVIEIKLKDRAANEYTYQSKFDFVEKTTDVLPEVVSTEPANRSFKNSVIKITAILKDNSGKGIDFDASTIRLEDPNKLEISGFQTDDKNQTIIWELSDPLPTDGSADGIYTIKVKAVDKKGGSKEYTASFVYDTKVPSIISVTPADKSVITGSLTSITLKVTDGIGSGIDFASSRNSMKLTINGKEITNILRSDNGIDTISFNFPALEENGRYTIDIKLKDRAGNEYAYQYRFDFVKKEADVLPEVVTTDPLDRSFKNSVLKVSAELKDNSGKGIDLEASTIRLLDPQKVEIPGIQSDDNKQTIIWELTKPLPTDGSADGTYTIKVNAVDKSGGSIEYSYTFLYDTEVPALLSITPKDGSILTTSPREITAKVSDTGSGVDFTASRSSMKLLLNSKEIPNILRSDNGSDTLIFNFNKLEDFGKYTIEIKLRDRAGNEYSYQSKFDYVKSTTESLPEVVSVDPQDRSFKNSVSKVNAVLKDNSGKGIDLESSIIRLVDPNGIEIEGFQTNDKNQTIIWELQKSLPTDGSVDGVYTIKVKAVDKAEGVKEFNFTFLYDTKVPSLVSIEPNDGSILTTSPTQIVAKVSDSESGIDFIASKNSMKLLISGKEVPNISRSDNGVDTLTFSFASLTDLGRYTIELKLKDRAGNEFTYQTKFDYVRRPTEALPEVLSTDPPDKSFRNSISTVSAVLKDKSGKGIDFEVSSIRLIDPKGNEVSGRQSDDNNQTIKWELSNPLLTDGSVDGTYTIKINVVDNTGESADYTTTFLYDSIAPSVIKTVPAANASLYEDISQVSVQLSDGEGSGVDLKGTDVKLQGPKAQVQTNRSDGADNTITLTFPKLSETGSYIIQVTPKDRAGNVGYLTQVKFSYVLKAPAVKSVKLTNRDYIHELNTIEAVLDDRSGIGLDLSETGSTIVVKGPDGRIIQGDQTSVGNDTIVWSIVTPLADDGSDDGIYTVTITPVDTLGTAGQSRQYTLVYDTQPPKIISATPVDMYANISYIGQQITSIQAKLQDEGPAGIKIGDQKIYLEAEDGSQVPGVQTDNNADTIIWNLTSPLPRDGSADGMYNMVVIATDKAGSQKEFRYPIYYDTIPPKVVEVSPDENSIQTKSITEVSIKVTDEGKGKIDFEKSKIELLYEDGSQITGLLKNNGLDTITLSFPSLEKSGVYTIRVYAIDKAGNGTTKSHEYRFVFKTGLPVVLSTTPITNPPEKAYVNQQLKEVRVTLQETDSGGIDLSPTGSKIELRGPNDKPIIGNQTNDGRNTLIYLLGKPLATDGSDDGQYKITVTAVNSAKRMDQERTFSFIYDTQAPEVIWATPPINVNASLSYINSFITELQVKLRDKGPAGLDLNRSTIRITDLSGKMVEGTSSNDEKDTLTFSFPSGLSMEGEYTLAVVAVDKAGNSMPVSIRFVYGISIPKVVSTVPVTAPAEKAYTNVQIKEVKAVLSETGTSGIDFSPTGSTIKLFGPKGNEMPGIQSNNGKDTLIFTLTKPLSIDGSDDGEYTISVTPANSAKLKGQKVDLKFYYDTVPPKININDIDLWYIGETGSSLNKITAIVKDDQPSSGIDWDNADNSWFKLQDSGGKDILGAVYVNKEKSELTFLLDSPLASNGSDDGFYTAIVAAKDKAGNKTDPIVQYRFLYDTKPPKLRKSEITINEKILLLDTSLDEYPTAVNTKNGVTIVAKMEDDGVGVDLTKSSITIYDPEGKKVEGSLMQDGKETIWIKTGMLPKEGKYKVEINPVDLDENGKNKSLETIFTEFLFELTKPEAKILQPGVGSADTESENKPIMIKGSATDKSSVDIPASGIAKVEVGGIGPGGKELEWIEALDDSKAREANQPELSRWYLNFLPDRSGTYKIKLRVWDNAGNYEIYDTKLELTFTISLSFQGSAYCWPNPVTNGVAHISFEVNTPESQDVSVTVYIYDVSGDLVYEEEHRNVPTKTRMNIEWECINSSGRKVATGIYIFRLKASLNDGKEEVYKVGKPIIIKN
ncbi:MAG: Ig-like domain-containing protein [bacterium]